MVSHSAAMSSANLRVARLRREDRVSSEGEAEVAAWVAEDVLAMVQLLHMIAKSCIPTMIARARLSDWKAWYRAPYSSRTSMSCL